MGSGDDLTGWRMGTSITVCGRIGLFIHDFFFKFNKLQSHRVVSISRCLLLVNIFEDGISKGEVHQRDFSEELTEEKTKKQGIRKSLSLSSVRSLANSSIA